MYYFSLITVRWAVQWIHAINSSAVHAFSRIVLFCFQQRVLRSTLCKILFWVTIETDISNFMASVAANYPWSSCKLDWLIIQIFKKSTIDCCFLRLHFRMNCVSLLEGLNSHLCSLLSSCVVSNLFHRTWLSSFCLIVNRSFCIDSNSFISVFLDTGFPFTHADRNEECVSETSLFMVSVLFYTSIFWRHRTVVIWFKCSKRTLFETSWHVLVYFRILKAKIFEH